MLEDYVAHLKELAEQFHTEWVKSRVTNPREWPLMMNQADWDEQFMAFLTGDIDV